MSGAVAPGVPEELEAKRAAVEARLAALGSAVLAFSGGVDSTLLLALGRGVLGGRQLAVIGVSETLPQGELEAATQCATQLGVRIEAVRTRELDDDRFTANPPDRCFWCKTELMGQLERIREREGFAAIVDGTNADDALDHRPGREAAVAVGVVSPLAEAGLTKTEIRSLARALGLPTWDKPSLACLASRIPYGTAITEDLLASVAKAEGALVALGFRTARVRHHGNVARVEVPLGDLERALALRDQIVRACRDAGFTFVALDLVGYHTGSMNEALKSPNA